MTEEINEAVNMALLVQKMDDACKKLDDLRDDIKALNGTVRTDSIRITILEERLGPWARTQAAYSTMITLIGSLFAAWWGGKQ